MQISRGIIKGAQKVVCYGPEGIGKSTFASKFPDPVFSDVEDSTKHMDVARLPKASSWTMLLSQATYVRDTPGICKTYVVDTADWAEILCTNHVCSSKGVTGIEDIGYGKGYTYLYEEFGRFLNILTEVVERGITVVLNAHAKMRKFEQPDEMGAYDRWEMKLSKGVAPLVKEWADMVLFARYKVVVVNVDNQGAAKGKNKAQGGQRVMNTSHNPSWDAKNRHGLPEELPFDYSKIAHCFTATAAAAPPPADPPKQTAPATPPVAPPVDPTPPPKEEQKYTGNFPPTDEKPIKPVPPLDPAIPKALRDLMEPNLVTEAEIQEAVAKRGYYPVDTPIKNYDAQFISGVLVGAWAQIFKYIEDEIRDLPFN